MLFFSINEKFAINPNTIPTTDSVVLKWANQITLHFKG
jgi:hypothetical protein